MVLVVMRRLPLSIYAALLLLSALVGQAVARTGSGGVCPPPHAEQLLSDSQADIYIAQTGGKFGPILTYGCVYGHRRAYALGEDNEGCTGSAEATCGGVDLFTLRGTVVAYEESEPPSPQVIEAVRYHVVARDLRNGRILRKALTGARAGIGPATAIVTTSSGSLAWIVEVEEENENTGAPAVYEVRAADKSGVRVLASGSGIAPTSLALAGSTVYWTQGGKPASTILH